MVIIQKISRAILLLATLLLIMNRILPHHHHQEEVCFAAAHCSEENEDHHGPDMEKSGVNHNHHSNSSDSCQIINYYLTPDGKNLTGKIKQKKLNRILYLNALPRVNKNMLAYVDSSSESIFIKSPFRLNAKCLTRSLRAPPYS